MFVLFASPAWTQGFPCESAKLVVLWAPGDSTDVICRIIAASANNVGAAPRLQIVKVGGELTAHGTTVKYLNRKNYRAYLADTYAKWEVIAIGVGMYEH